MDVGDFLRFFAEKLPDRTAIVCENVRLSYRELNNRANHLAYALLKNGLKKRDKVAILSMNSPYYAEMFYGVAKAGGVFVPINFRLAPEEILYTLDNSDTKILIFEKELEALVTPIRSRLTKVERFLSVGGDVEGSQAYEDLLAGQPDTEPDVALSEEDECQLMYTSGTTGKPKGVLRLHRHVIYNSMNTIIGKELRPEQTCIVAQPLFHTAALNNFLTVSIALGHTTVILRRFNAEAFMELLQKEKVDLLYGTPTIFTMLIEIPDVKKRYDTRLITKITSGSAPMLKGMVEKLASLFPNAVGVYESYALTEAGPNVTQSTGQEGLKKPGTVGKALNFVQLKIVDGNGREMPTGEVGEIICKGPSIMKEYYKNEKATKETLRNGWLYTGDLGKLDAEGYLYIVGRKKEMILSGGENIYPREIEELLWNHPKVADVAVIGVPDEKWGESVRAVVQLKPGEKMTEEEVIQFCKQHIASYKKPKSVVFVSQLPRNPAGKLVKDEVKAKYGQSK